MHLEWNVIRLVYVHWTSNVITELFVFIELQQQSMHSVVELWQWVYWMVPTSVHKCERKEKFGCTGIFGSRIFYKHLQWRVDEAEWKCKKNSKGRKSIKYWKDIIFILVLLLLLLLSTVSASVTQEISRHVNKEVKIDSISITRPSLSDIFLIFISFSALGY